MLLKRVRAGPWGTVLAICSARGDCEVLTLLKGAANPDSDRFGRDKARMLGGISEAAKKGPQACGLSSHEIGDCYQWAVGGIRLLWFYDGRQIILVHGFSKDSRKTRKRDVNKGNALRDEYLKAKVAGKIKLSD